MHSVSSEVARRYLEEYYQRLGAKHMGTPRQHEETHNYVNTDNKRHASMRGMRGDKAHGKRMSVDIGLMVAHGNKTNPLFQHHHRRHDQDHTKHDKDHMRWDQDHMRCDQDHMRCDQDHMRCDQDHRRHDQDHTKHDKDHMRCDQDHMKHDKDPKRRDISLSHKWLLSLKPRLKMTAPETVDDKLERDDPCLFPQQSSPHRWWASKRRTRSLIKQKPAEEKKQGLHRSGTGTFHHQPSSNGL